MSKLVFLAAVLLSTALVHSTLSSGLNSTSRPNLTDFNREVNQLIVNGRPATEREFPFMVSIRAGGAHWCGGTLFSPRHVLTTANCVAVLHPNSLTVHAGIVNLNDQGVRVKVDSIETHRGWDPVWMRNNVAVLILKEPIKQSSRIKYVELSNSLDDAKPKTKATVTGWGRTHNKPGSDVLLAIDDLRIVDKDTCAKAHGNQFRDEYICAGEKQSICHGDTGGPLVIKQIDDETKEEKFVQIEIARPLPINSCDKSPAAFISVSHNFKWIMDTGVEYCFL